jgi:YHS domain-containing protein
MADLDDLDRRIQEKLAEQKGRLQSQQKDLEQRMHQVDEKYRQYTALADRLIQDIIRPRLEKLVSHLDNAELLTPEQAGRHQCVACFQHTEQFPARARLELGVSRDGLVERLFLLFHLEILPVFFSFPNREELAFPIKEVDDEKAAAWIDAKIVGFLDTYLRLETLDHYQNGNLVVDPVCGMRLNKNYAAAQAEYKGRRYYFCVPDCGKKFAENPARYLEPSREVMTGTE